MAPPSFEPNRPHNIAGLSVKEEYEQGPVA